MVYIQRFLWTISVSVVCLMLFGVLKASTVAAAEDIVPLMNSGKNLLDQKKYDGAITAFTAAIIRDPKSREGYRMRGITYRAMKKYDESISDFTRAIVLDPQGYDLYAGRAITKREMNNLPGAIEDMAVAARLTSQKDALRVIMMLAEFKFDAGDYLGSLESCSKAKQLQLSPETANCVGKSMLKLGQYEKAIQEFDSIIPMNDHIYYVFRYRAKANLELGNLDKARKDFNRAIELKQDLANQKDVQDDLVKLAAMQKAADEKQAKDAADAKAAKDAADAKAAKDAADAKAAKDAAASAPTQPSTGGQGTTF